LQRSKMVYIQWVDSNIMHGWQSDLENCDVALSNEIGYMVHEDEDKIILARGISSQGFYNSPMSIPSGCIKIKKELRIK